MQPHDNEHGDFAETDRPSLGQLIRSYQEGKDLARQATALWEAMDPEVRALAWDQMDAADRETIEFAVRINDTNGQHLFDRTAPPDENTDHQVDHQDQAAGDGVPAAAELPNDGLYDAEYDPTKDYEYYERNPFVEDVFDDGSEW